MAMHARPIQQVDGTKSKQAASLGSAPRTGTMAMPTSLIIPRSVLLATVLAGRGQEVLLLAVYLQR